MLSPVPRHCIWVCFFLLAFLSGDGSLRARAETSHGPGGVKVARYTNMDAPGNDAKWVRGVASVEQCESLCLADTACAGYTYNINKSTCIPKTIIGPLSPTREAAITGIVDRRSGGSAAQNRAMMVEGKPSFDCRKAHSETAQAICGSTNLIQLDLQLAKLYWAKMAKLKGPAPRRRSAVNMIGALPATNAARTSPAWNSPISAGSPSLADKFQSRRPQPSQAPPPPVQQVVEQKPQEEALARPKGPIATVQQLPNPIRLIGQADQPCDVASATLTRLRKSLSVSVPDGLTVQAEELAQFYLEGERRAAAGARLSRSCGGRARARRKGTGFYALTPEAKAPFRIKQFLKDTRVIIPLHVKGAPQSGEVKIRPLIAGPLKVSAAIIGYTQCGENPDPAPIVFDLTVEPGAPEIVIADRFDLAKPDQIIASPDGTRRLEIYGPRYRLIDVATGALLADEVGKEPRFSPTGRFVIARSEKRL